MSSLATEADRHRKQALRIASQIARTRPRVRLAEEQHEPDVDGVPIAHARASLVALEREHDLWMQLADEIDAYLAYDPAVVDTHAPDPDQAGLFGSEDHQ